MLPLQVYEEYRRRFGIESNYRMVNKLRIRTCTKLAVVRYMLYRFRVYVVEFTDIFKWTYLHLRQRGPRVVLCELFTLEPFFIWLWEVLKEHLGPS